MERPQRDGSREGRKQTSAVVWGVGSSVDGWCVSAEDEVRDMGRWQSLKALDCHPEYPRMSFQELEMLFALNYLGLCIPSGLNSVPSKFKSTPTLEFDFVWK